MPRRVRNSPSKWGWANGDGVAPRKLSMTNYFQRQLAYYADAHRDQVNSVMHIIGNPLLFVANR